LGKDALRRSKNTTVECLKKNTELQRRLIVLKEHIQEKDESKQKLGQEKEELERDIKYKDSDMKFLRKGKEDIKIRRERDRRINERADKLSNTHVARRWVLGLTHERAKQEMEKIKRDALKQATEEVDKELLAKGIHIVSKGGGNKLNPEF